jgi:hypothetical protein
MCKLPSRCKGIISHSIHWTFLAQAIAMTRTLVETEAARKWVDRGARYTHVTTTSNGRWDTMAKEPEKLG